MGLRIGAVEELDIPTGPDQVLAKVAAVLEGLEYNASLARRRTGAGGLAGGELGGGQSGDLHRGHSRVLSLAGCLPAGARRQGHSQ